MSSRAFLSILLCLSYSPAFGQAGCDELALLEYDYDAIGKAVNYTVMAQETNSRGETVQACELNWKMLQQYSNMVNRRISCGDEYGADKAINKLGEAATTGWFASACKEYYAQKYGFQVPPW